MHTISHSRMPRSNSFSDLSETMKQKMASIAKNQDEQQFLTTKDDSSPLGSTRVLETSRKLLASLNNGTTKNNNKMIHSFSINRNINFNSNQVQNVRKRNISLEKSLK